jgi:formylglycine-generating enzyme required for sulfatase activity
VFLKVLAEPAPAAGADVRVRTRRRANAAAALFLLGRPDVVRAWLGQGDDPDLRTELIDRLPALVPFDALWPLRLAPSNDLTRQAVLMAADGYRVNGTLTPDRRARLEAEAAELFARDESAAVHAAAEWLLRTHGKAAAIDALTNRLAGAARPNWWVTRTGLTFVLVRGPIDFQIGSPPDEVRRDTDLEDRRPRHIPHSYAIGMHEVTVTQFRRFFPNHKFADDVVQSPDCPANKISWYDAARYCRRLSEEEDIPEKEMVYPPVDNIRSDRPLVLPADWQRRTGYRLPTEAEWEVACRAGTTTARFYGTTADALSKYAWWIGNADELCWPVGSLRPNPIGLFDVLGNVGEWCHDRRLWYVHEPIDGDVAPVVQPTEYRAFRGGFWQQPAKSVRSAKRDATAPSNGFSYNGFRVVRTVRPEAP